VSFDAPLDNFEIIYCQAMPNLPAVQSTKATAKPSAKQFQDSFLSSKKSPDNISYRDFFCMIMERKPSKNICQALPDLLL